MNDCWLAWKIPEDITKIIAESLSQGKSLKVLQSSTGLQSNATLYTTLGENTVVHLIKSCRFKQRCINVMDGLVLPPLQALGLDSSHSVPPLPSPTTKGSNISHKHEWRADFTSSQKEVQTAKNVKRGKVSFLYLLSLASSLLPISMHFRSDVWVQCSTPGDHRVFP